MLAPLIPDPSLSEGEGARRHTRAASDVTSPRPHTARAALARSAAAWYNGAYYSSESTCRWKEICRDSLAHDAQTAGRGAQPWWRMSSHSSAHFSSTLLGS